MVKTGHTEYFMPSSEIKDYNVMQNLCDQWVQNNARTYKNLLKIMTGQGDDYTTFYVLFYPYFNEHYMMRAIDLSKQQVLDADPKGIQQINFTANLD